MAGRNDGWVPQQHGAWAMILVPAVVGLALRARDESLPTWAVPVCLTWLLGYFCFNAASLWLKAPARRRARFVRPLGVWTSVTAAAGALTLLTGGFGLLWWAPVFAPLLGASLWLAARRKDRSTLSGLATVTAACLLAPILRWGAPSEVWHAMPQDPTTTWTFAALFGYFFGTVLHVKTLIRERGSWTWRWASWLWHGGWTMTSVWAATNATTHWWWTVFFGLLLARSLVLVRVSGDRRVTPLQIGLVEIAASALALGACLL